MRETDERAGQLFSYIDLEARVRRDHPLRESARSPTMAWNASVRFFDAPCPGRSPIAGSLTDDIIYSLLNNEQMVETYFAEQSRHAAVAV
jgi:hypothetical protein